MMNWRPLFTWKWPTRSSAARSFNAQPQDVWRTLAQVMGPQNGIPGKSMNGTAEPTSMGAFSLGIASFDVDINIAPVCRKTGDTAEELEVIGSRVLIEVIPDVKPLQVFLWALSVIVVAFLAYWFSLLFLSLLLLPFAHFMIAIRHGSLAVLKELFTIIAKAHPLEIEIEDEDEDEAREGDGRSETV